MRFWKRGGGEVEVGERIEPEEESRVTYDQRVDIEN
jgi:hypothetical protein